MTTYRRLFLIGALALAAVSGACARSGPTDASGQPLEPLTVVTATGEHAFLVEIADNEEERQRGLMFRPPLPDDRGMLFQWPGEQPQERGFWMHNTPSSLDIIYIAADGRIISIASHATPNSDAIIPSNGPAAGVLELRAGRAGEIGAKPGDRVVHPYFGS